MTDLTLPPAVVAPPARPAAGRSRGATGDPGTPDFERTLERIATASNPPTPKRADAIGGRAPHDQRSAPTPSGATMEPRADGSASTGAGQAVTEPDEEPAQGVDAEPSTSSPSASDQALLPSSPGSTSPPPVEPLVTPPAPVPVQAPPEAVAAARSVQPIDAGAATIGGAASQPPAATVPPVAPAAAVATGEPEAAAVAPTPPLGAGAAVPLLGAAVPPPSGGVPLGDVSLSPSTGTTAAPASDQGDHRAVPELAATDTTALDTPTPARPSTAPAEAPAPPIAAPPAPPAPAPAQPVAEATSASSVPATAGGERAQAGEPWEQVHRALGSLRHLEDGSQQIRVRLHPEELGEVLVEVTAHRGELRIQLVAETPAARDRLGAELGQLGSKLAESGLRPTSLDVGSGNGSERGQDQRQPARLDTRGRNVELDIALTARQQGTGRVSRRLDMVL